MVLSMFTKTFFVVLSLIVASSTTNGLVLNCNFANRTAWVSNNVNVYSCLAEVMFLSDPRNVTEISYNHLAGRNNSDVKLLLIENQLQLTVFPRNIYQFFPNLEAVRLYITGIAELNHEDLRGLPKLKGIGLNTGKITEVGSRTFEGQPLLERLSIITQQLQHFGHRVFDNLPKLTQLNVEQNPCINFNAENRAAVVNLVGQIFRSCPASFKMNLDDILVSPEFLGVVEQEVALQVYPHHAKLLETERRVERLEERVRVLEENCA